MLITFVRKKHKKDFTCLFPLRTVNFCKNPAQVDCQRLVPFDSGYLLHAVQKRLDENWWAVWSKWKKNKQKRGETLLWEIVTKHSSAIKQNNNKVEYVENNNKKEKIKRKQILPRMFMLRTIPMMLAVCYQEEHINIHKYTNSHTYVQQNEKRAIKSDFRRDFLFTFSVYFFRLLRALRQNHLLYTHTKKHTRIPSTSLHKPAHGKLTL